MVAPPLLPRPRKIRLREGRFRTRADTPIVLRQTDEHSVRSAKALGAAIESATGRRLPIESHARADGLGRRIELQREGEHGDGYRVRIRTNDIELVGEGPAGLRYAVETLSQLFRAGRGGSVPTGSIDDAPDLEHRGVLIDISRGKVPTVATLRGVLDWMVGMKLNLLMLYTEHTFQFRRHPAIGRGWSPLSAADLLELDAYAAERHIELVPTLQSLGHMHHLLKMRRYRPLAESPRRWSVSPAVPEVYELLDDLYSEYLGNFRSGWFNANCDEPVDLGRGRSREWAERVGRGAVFRAHLERVSALARRYGKKTMFWGDVVHEHPEQIPLLDRDNLLLDWWYEANHDFDRVRVFRDHSIPFMVCSGTTSWNTLFPRGDNAIENIAGHARAGKKYGARGLINTDWGDNGHYNLLGNSIHALSYGAQASWGTDRVEPGALDRAISLHVFGDRSGAIGRLYRRMGGIHATGFDHFNNSPLKTLYFDDVHQGKFYPQVKPTILARTLRALERERERFAAIAPQWAERPIAREELRFAIDASVLAAEKGLGKKSPRRLAREQERLMGRHRELWLRRNRPSNFGATERLYRTSIDSLRRRP
ncbi:MAG: glycoside hydrolase family 20 zincin-like fold domain-containing protein [Myxococcota bacterium]